MAKRGITRANILPLLRIVAPYPKLVAIGLVALALGGAVNLALPALVRQSIDGEARLLLARPWTMIALLVALFAFQAICFFFRSYCFNLLGVQVVRDLRNRLYRSLLLKPIPFFDLQRHQDLVSRLTSDSQLVQDAVGVRLSVVIRYLFQVTAGVLLMAALSPRLSVALLLTLPPVIALGGPFSRRLRTLTKDLQAKLAHSATISAESFQGLRVIRAFQAEELETHRFEDANATVAQAGRARAHFSAFFSSSLNFLLVSVVTLVLIYGVHLVSQGALTSGELAAFMLYGAIVAASFGFLLNGYVELVQSEAPLERITALIDSKELSSPHAGPLEAAPEIRFQHVSFSYPSRPDSPALTDVSFTIPAGRTTALVGPSGGGKSTAVSLILGFYEPSAGDVRFSADPEAVRSHAGWVPQDGIFFGGSIEENLRYANPKATIEQMRAACAEVSLDQFIDSLPAKFATIVGEGGTQLSGGQRQRLAIARALLRNPVLLVLDEPTSQLDAENEFLVKQALQRVTKNRTVLIIAHRLSTVQQADQLLVLEGGKVVQQGTHGQLSKEPGLYQRLVERQELV